MKTIQAIQAKIEELKKWPDMPRPFDELHSAALGLIRRHGRRDEQGSRKVANLESGSHILRLEYDPEEREDLISIYLGHGEKYQYQVQMARNEPFKPREPTFFEHLAYNVPFLRNWVLKGFRSQLERHWHSIEHEGETVRHNYQD